MSTNNAANIAAKVGTQIINQVAHGFTVGQVLYQNAAVWTLAIATSEAASVTQGVVIKSIDADNFILQSNGIVDGLAGLTAGDVYYLSGTVAGDVTNVRPTLNTILVKPVFIAQSTTSALLINDSNFLNAPSSSNILINGDFQIAQRGTSFTSTTNPPNSDDRYLFDQGILLSNGNDIVDVTRVSGSTGAAYGIQMDQETANLQWMYVLPIINTTTLPLLNHDITFSISAKKGAGNATAGNIRIGIIEWTGTADAITSDVVATWAGGGTNPTLAANWAYINTPATIALTTSYARYSTTATVGGSAANLACIIWLDDTNATIADTIDFSGVKLELGSIATAFNSKPFSQEQSDCLYTFHRIGNIVGVDGTIAAGFNNSTTRAYMAVTYSSPMRVPPSVTPSAVSDLQNLSVAGAIPGTAAIISPLRSTCRYIIDVAAGLTAGEGSVLIFENSSSGRFLDFSAEL